MYMVFRTASEGWKRRSLIRQVLKKTSTLVVVFAANFHALLAQELYKYVPYYGALLAFSPDLPCTS